MPSPTTHFQHMISDQRFAVDDGVATCAAGPYQVKVLPRPCWRAFLELSLRDDGQIIERHGGSLESMCELARSLADIYGAEAPVPVSS